jgi:hypothetical protein
MAPTRPVPLTGRPPARTLPGPAEETAGAARYAARLEALLGDPRDRRNPYGRSALWAAPPDGLPAPPDGLPAPADGLPDALPGLPALPALPALPGRSDAGETRWAAGRLARALRPLFRRDLALAHAWSIRPLLDAPLPHPAAALLGPAALLASAAGVLRGTTGVVDGLSRYEPGARQWRPVLASVFADLLACESLTAIALRSCPDRGPGTEGPGTDGPVPDPRSWESPAAAVGYLVPRLVGELLDELELVMDECGLDGDTVERRSLARIRGARAFARLDRTAAGAAQARLVRGLNGAGGPWPDDGTELTALFRTDAAALAVTPGTDCPGAVTSGPAGAGNGLAGADGGFAGVSGFPVGVSGSPGGVSSVLGGADDGLAGAPGPLADADEPDASALARVGRRLAAEQRALSSACAATVVHDPADPAARALADRQALLLLAAAVLGVREAAADARLPFLGGTGWALLALGRITGRLGLPQPGRTPDPKPGVWDELARRAANGLDCDLYATRLPW